MNSTQATARTVGLLYLLTLVLTPINRLYISSRFIVRGDSAATAHSITAAEPIYLLGILCGLVSELVFLFLALNLYGLLKDVDRKLTRLMLTLAAVSVAFGFVNLLSLIAPLVLLSGTPFGSAFTAPQLDALAYAFLRLRISGVALAMAFWGLWLLPFGVLVIKSGRFPRLLGILLIVGGIAYLAVSVTAIGWPAYRQSVGQALLPFYAFGELSMIGWLLVKGAKAPPLGARVAEAV